MSPRCCDMTIHSQGRTHVFARALYALATQGKHMGVPLQKCIMPFPQRKGLFEK